MEADGIRPVDHGCRNDVDAISKQIYRQGRFAVMPAPRAPLLVKLWGPTEQRIDQLDQPDQPVSQRQQQGCA